MYSAFDNIHVTENVNEAHLSKEQILSLEINDLYVYIKPLNLVNPLMTIALRYQDTLKKAAAQNLNHSAIIVHTENNLLILIEYGAYNEDGDANRNNKFHYYQGNDGLRFIQISNSLFHSMKSEQRSFCIHCKIHIRTKISVLLQEAQLYSNHQWRKCSYNFLTHNCQHFVSTAIRVLGATDDSLVDNENIPLIIQNAFSENEKLYGDE